MILFTGIQLLECIVDAILVCTCVSCSTSLTRLPWYILTTYDLALILNTQLSNNILLTCRGPSIFNDFSPGIDFYEELCSWRHQGW